MVTLVITLLLSTSAPAATFTDGVISSNDLVDPVSHRIERIASELGTDAETFLASEVLNPRYWTSQPRSEFNQFEIKQLEVIASLLLGGINTEADFESSRSKYILEQLARMAIRLPVENPDPIGAMAAAPDGLFQVGRLQAAVLSRLIRRVTYKEYTDPLEMKKDITATFKVLLRFHMLSASNGGRSRRIPINWLARVVHWYDQREAGRMVRERFWRTVESQLSDSTPWLTARDKGIAIGDLPPLTTSRSIDGIARDVVWVLAWYWPGPEEACERILNSLADDAKVI